MTPDEERWAEALEVARTHGDKAVLHEARRVAALRLAGDMAGIERWRGITAKLDRLVKDRSTVQ